jgi:hypothetical protein
LENAEKVQKERLRKEILMEISDSLARKQQPQYTKKVVKKNIKYYDDSGSEKECVVEKNYISADSLNHLSDGEAYEYSVTKTKSVSVSPRFDRDASQRMSRKDFIREQQKRLRVTSSESPCGRDKEKSSRHPARSLSKSMSKETVSDPTDVTSKYMDWYYNLSSKDSKDDSDERKSFRKSNKTNRAPIPHAKSEERSDESQMSRHPKKPEPLPRTRDTVLLKEEFALSKKPSALQPEDSTRHPLLQHSEHRYEGDYKVQIKIVDASNKSNKHHHSPVKQESGDAPTKGGATTTTILNKDSTANLPTRQLNVNTLEDDHDSGIAMNSLLKESRQKKPSIADKKSVFTIAYDDVRIKHLRSESDTPPFT